MNQINDWLVANGDRIALVLVWASVANLALGILAVLGIVFTEPPSP